MITPRMTVAEVLRKKPSAKKVLFKYGICDCCGGNVSLEDSAKFRGVDVKALIREIEES